ncbi:MAG TPA: D-alanyl-D-alanine carboxypeptidase/D-alanyl-D-alanine-endopeptidase [Thiobacillaceae bacterium]|nr:D-alanyl-D-alanine carboxypeptidase/D-alanyl-D-alanine-endopeptidase [Thiobacillaceae bacterium]
MIRGLGRGMRGWIPVCVGLALCGSAQAQLPESVALALQQAGIPDSHVGVVVRELDGGILLQHAADQTMNPASVMKLLTTLAALDSLGPAHTFKTRVWLEGELEDGVLHGNLVLQGGGDPALTQERFWLLLRALRARGLKEIRGDLLLDHSYYAIPTEDPGAFDQAPLRPYNAQPAALLVNFNTQTLRLDSRPGGVEAWLDPGTARPGLDNRLRAADAACDTWAADFDTRLENGSLVLSGSVPSRCGPLSLALNLLPPADNTAAWFRALWRELGGLHSGQLRLGTAAPGARLFLEFDSPPLSLLVREVNKYSNNVMAKMLFLHLGAQRFGAPATWEKGERALRAWLAERGLRAPGLVLENGAGLSRIERISADTLARLLVWASRQPAYYEWAASLPAVGLEGTQKNRFNGDGRADTDLRGRAWMKSGSLNGARGQAGYVLTRDGRRRVLAFLINHPNAARSGAAQDALLAWAAGAAPDEPGTMEDADGHNQDFSAP